MIVPCCAAWNLDVVVQRALVEAAIAGLARVGLPTATPGTFSGDLDDDTFDAVIASARANRMLGLLAVAVESSEVPATAAQADRVYEAAASAIRGDLELESLMVESGRWLDAAEIPFRVLKGPAIAHLDEIDPIRRSFGDIDLLIPGDRFADAVRTFAAKGFARTFPEPRPGFDGRFSKGACVRREGLEVDLHRTLAPGPFGMRIPVEELWSRSEHFQVDGADFEAMPADLRLLHAAYHAVLGGSTPRLVALRDFVLLTSRPDVDAVAVASTAGRWEGTIVLRRAVAAVRDRLGLQLEGYTDALPAEPDPRWQLRAMRAYGAGSGRYARQAFASLGAIQRPMDRLRYLIALTFPAGSYVDERHAGRLSRGRHALRAIAGRSSR